MNGNFANDRHALYCGWVLGKLQGLDAEVRPVRDAASNYLPRLDLELASGEVVRLFIPEPSDDWGLS